MRTIRVFLAHWRRRLNESFLVFSHKSSYTVNADRLQLWETIALLEWYLLDLLFERNRAMSKIKEYNRRHNCTYISTLIIHTEGWFVARCKVCYYVGTFYRQIHVNRWTLIVERNRNYQSIKIPFVRELYAHTGMTLIASKIFAM